ncbi:germination protein [Paenibacillus sp. CCS19]|uniref:GerAB/ArcD/ProY family transporter n=1 Tax=Paenibacillus sp. CCS19 TaxID=3158387 RepID=UPI00256A22B2|nr:endospore germination permease [Paenibacillus cellulosilyticus]GMK40390.1 germination protein [Paenibacillus cellulosilyticus]
MNGDPLRADQFKKMVFLFTIGTSIILIPSTLASDAKNDAWIVIILGSLVGMILIGLYLALSYLVPGKTIVEICFAVLGRWLGLAASLLFFQFVFVLTILVMRNLGDFLTGSMFPETPISAIHLVYLLVAIMGVRYGLPNIARTMDIFYPFIVFLFIIFALLLLPELHFNNLLPVLVNGVSPIANASYSYISFPCLEFVIFLMIFPKVEQGKERGKAFLKGALLGGAVLFVITLLCLLVMGAEMTASNMYASFELAKIIKIGEFLQRIEVIIAVIWFVTSFCKLIICFHIMIESFSQSFKLKDSRPLLLPWGMVVLAESILAAPDMGYLLSFDRYSWTVYAFTFGFAFPVLLLLAAIIRFKPTTPAAPTSSDTDAA